MTDMARGRIGSYSADQVAQYYARGDWQDRVLYDLIRDHARDIGDRVFVTDGTRQLTYRELREAAVRLAAGLSAAGIGRGDRVAVQMPNWSEFAVITVALSRLGAVMVPIMPVFRQDELRYIVGHSGAVAMIGPDRFRGFSYLDMFREVQADSPELRLLIALRTEPGAELGAAVPFESLLAEGDVEELDDALGETARPDEGCLIVYTSGTTARPKGCFHSFNTLHAAATGIIRALGVTADDVYFNPSPVTHSTGLVTGMLVPMLVGGGSHFMDAWVPAEAPGRIAEHRCTIAFTSMTFLSGLTQAYDPALHDVSSMRYWVCAGAPIPGPLVQQASALFEGCAILSLYGRTENMVTTMCGPSDPPERSVTSDGKAVPGTEVAIVDTDGEVVPVGTEGDIAYRGPSHMLEYYRDPEQTAALYTPDGLSMSGDLGVMDGDGYVRVSGRVKDIIIRGGMNISSREVEDLLTAHPAVLDVAVVAMPDPVLGERSCAFVVPAPGAAQPTLDDLTGYLRGKQIALQKLPERLEIVEALPKTAVGKVRKNVLRELVAERLREETGAVSESVAG